jgi:hypothetical protein
VGLSVENDEIHGTGSCECKDSGSYIASVFWRNSEEALVGRIEKAKGNRRRNGQGRSQIM